VWRASFAYFVLTLAATWPLARQLDAAVPHDLGDPLLVTYLLNWNATVTPLTERWWHPPFFWPASDVMALSEHMLGLSLVATPLRWLGFSALAAYNVLFIASFWTAGMGGWVLGWTLTRRSLPAFVSGLVFMLAPYRFSHLPHLQMLMSCGVPVMFAALHRALDRRPSRESAAADTAPVSSTNADSRREWIWIAVATVCWWWQGLVSGYFLAFLPIGVGVWLLWFARDRLSVWWKLALCGGLGALLLTPVLQRYAAVHEAGAFKRQLSEVLEFSADVAGLWQVDDRLGLWGGVLPRGFTEEQMFPGLATLILVAVGVSLLPWRWRGRRGRRMTWILFALAGLCFAAAAVARFMPLALLGDHLTLSSAHKPLGMAWVLLIAAAFSSETMREAAKGRSAVAGYLLIALATWILTLGPVPTLWGHRIWYRAPYWWLYEYAPGFQEFRVPARLFVITIAALAALAALGTERLLRLRRGIGVSIVCVLMAGVVAEGWLARMPLAPAPRPIDVPAIASVVIELPTNDPARDSVAMYRSLFHGHPVANGWSGYAPPEVRELRRIDGGNAAVLRDWAARGPVAIIVHTDAPALSRYQTLLKEVGASCSTSSDAMVCTVTSDRTSACAACAESGDGRNPSHGR
jgi:hypothetical protein